LPPSLQTERGLLDAAGMLEVAAAIGGRLSREAIWHGERCNWIGSQIGAGERGEPVEFLTALDATLYEGTSGVALFLAELHRLTGDSDARRTALGAIRQALSAAPLEGRGLYSGTPGVAVATARVGRLLSEEGLEESARELVPSFTQPTSDDEELDLLNGTAGTILALLALDRVHGDAGLLEVAVSLGDELVGAAVQEDDGAISWPSPGAAGIALALIELADVSGERRFSQAAEAGFDYERSTFNPSEGNWPDLRELYPTSNPDEPGYATFWCHGGPGIALSRLTAFERLGAPRWRSEAEAGLAAARTTVERGLRHGGSNYSLCHGLAGNAEILADGARVLGGSWKRWRTAAVEAATVGVERHGAEGPWPGGAGAREGMGLMLGIAGTGYFFLRAAGAPVPSLLRPDPTFVGD